MPRLSLPSRKLSALFTKLTMSDDETAKPKKLRLSRDTPPPSEAKSSDRESEHPTKACNTNNANGAQASSEKASRNPASASSASSSSSSSSAAIHPEKANSSGGPPPLPASRAGSSDSSNSPVADPTVSATSRSKLKLSQDSNTGSSGGGAPTGQLADAGSTDEDVKTTPESQSQNVEKNPHSILPSLLIVGILFLLLGGAAFGLWKIVFAGGEAAVNQTAEAAEGNPPLTEGSPKNPIERAKQTISKAPGFDLEQLALESGPSPETATVGEGENAIKETKLLPPDKTLTRVRAESAAEIEATKATVSQFLAALHIGGMRDGARPMVLIDGRAHNVGDTVQASTGLKFDGIRDGKLAFIDKNDIVYLKSF